MTLFTEEGLMFILRWLHFFFGITWIGILYYFNFIQGAFFNETDASTKSAAIQKLVPRALWWFRWGAMFTFITGFILIGMLGHQAGGLFFTSSRGILITMGGILGICMWYNVWFIIWPAQKVVIQSATQVAQGGSAIPEAAARGARAAIASRTNTLFSIPMLFLMGAASHLPIMVGYDGNFKGLWISFAVITGLIEINAMKGKMGPMASVKGVIHLGFLLAIVYYVLVEVML